MTHPGRLSTFERDGLIFDVRDAGPLDGLPVVLLHGWPGGPRTWDAVVGELAATGHRTIVPAQRGYSDRGRPTGGASYVISELVADVVALIDAAGFDRVHLVGHDWGGAVAWALAGRAPGRLDSLTVLSMPHPSAMAGAMLASDQGRRSAYIAGFQVPWVPEQMFLAFDGALLRRALVGSGLPRHLAGAYIDDLRRPGALTASLGWYRALRHARDWSTDPIETPTTYVWSSHDTALGRHAAERTSDHVTGPYRFVVLEGISHWIPEVVPALCARLVAASVGRPR